jgi:MraZ protein
MLNLLGEYDCKLDDKGRLVLPAGLKKQLQDVLHEGFVVNRDMFEACLVLYPTRQWMEVQAQIGKLNRFVEKNVRFIRKFNNGATPVELDAAGRMLIPAALAAHAGVLKDVKVTGNGDRIEIWDKARYEAMLNDGEDIGKLAEEVMGGIAPGQHE